MATSLNETRLANMLFCAHGTRETIEDLPRDLIPPDEDAAYRVAKQVLDALDSPLGAWKLGATAVDNLHTLGAARPIVGQIFADGIFRAPHTFVFDDLMTPVCEAEFAFELGTTLDAKRDGWTAEDVAACVAAVYPALEIGERRLSRNQVVPILALIADNSAAGKLVLGDAIANWRDVDFAAAAVMLRVNGVERGSGHGRDVLGHPLNALAWLANERGITGRPLEAGEVVITGSCTGMVRVERGKTHTGDFGSFGRIDVSFR